MDKSVYKRITIDTIDSYFDIKICKLFDNPQPPIGYIWYYYGRDYLNEHRKLCEYFFDINANKWRKLTQKHH